ncbi:hypothetical protein M011DRAFT_166552 [Sporormia fimetaria CBS 119925]|uniref:Uncharacterized protein n=1 Tax=Sporormia fimetaria CBS 119925 TaxID=1340428 RepID=A0A6A6V1T3_9PLEO|nr:hypothetical protein M011DRAFT_166552 [Sporormia fimetaria CBS 119925]
MQPEVLTPLAHFTKEESNDTSCPVLLVASSLLLHLETPFQQTEAMAKPSHSRGRSNDELWFSFSSEAREENKSERAPQQSAYQSTASRQRVHRSVSPARSRAVPTITTPLSLDKPLPPSPKRKTLSLRTLYRRRASDNTETARLQPEPNQTQRSPSSSASLSPGFPSWYHQPPSCRSMPSSPFHTSHNVASSPSTQSPVMERARSSASAYAQSARADQARLQRPSFEYSYSDPTEQARLEGPVSLLGYPDDSLGTFQITPPRTRRTFPETTTPSSATAPRRPSYSRATHSESNEPLHDASDFGLFVEATSGLPPGCLDFSTFSPTSPPRLHRSHFGDDRQNAAIPFPPRDPLAGQRSASAQGWQQSSCSEDAPLTSSSALPRRASQQSPIITSSAFDRRAPAPALRQHQRMSSSALPSRDCAESSTCRSTLPRTDSDEPFTSSSALPQRESQPDPRPNHHLTVANLELERLGINDEEQVNDDELPDYAQSQAEMSARRRREATARARELEARWAHARGR